MQSRTNRWRMWLDVIIIGLMIDRFRRLRKIAAAGWGAGLGLVIGCLGCGVDRRTRDRLPYRQTDSMGVSPTAVSVVPLRARPTLVENSAAAASTTQPGVFFTINDSGNDPVLFGLDTSGADRGAWRIVNAWNIDWEAAAVGPCGADRPDASCVFIGDVGDNARRRRSVTIYRVVEPPANQAAELGELVADAAHFRYPDGPHDVEAIFLGPNGSLRLVTKRELRAPDGRRRPALMFSVDSFDWRGVGETVARLVDSLPIVPGSAPGRFVTDAALDPARERLAIRTYFQVYVFSVDSMVTGLAMSHPAICNIAGLEERTGEGVMWTPGGRLALSSEGRDSPLHVIGDGCLDPKAATR